MLFLWTARTRIFMSYGFERARASRGRTTDKHLSSVVCPLFLEIPQQALDIIQLDLRAERVAEAPAQFLENAARALHVDFARHFHGRVVAVFVPAQRPAQRVSVLLGARGPGASGLPRPHAGSGLHLLRKVLRAAPQGFERAPLGVHRGIGIAVAERALGVAHRLLGAAERSLAPFARRLLPELLAALLHFIEQFSQLLAQRLLVLAQAAHALFLLALLALFALLPLLTLLPLLAALTALTIAA